MKRRKLTTKERHLIYNKCNGHCAYCGCELEYKKMQVDHVTPLRVGGVDELENMLPSCMSCNRYKATLDLEDFRIYLSGIPKRLMRDSVAFQVGERFGIVVISDTQIEFYFEKIQNDE